MIASPGAEFVAFDLETTGLSPSTNRIIEIGAIRFDASGQVLASFDVLVNPLQPSQPASRLIHGIDDETLQGAETAAMVLPRFVEFLGAADRTTMLAHNAFFDAGFLGHELIEAELALPGHFVIDTLAWSRRSWPRHGSHRLDVLANRLGFADPARHRALVDSRRVVAVFLGLLAEAGGDEDHPPLAYPIFDGAGPIPPPRGWEKIDEAIELKEVLQIEYLGGTRGKAPRAVVPQRFTHRGGVAYLVAECRLDGKIKEFQVDRIRTFRVLTSSES